MKALDFWLNGYSVNAEEFSIDALTWTKPNQVDFTWRMIGDVVVDDDYDPALAWSGQSLPLEQIHEMAFGLRWDRAIEHLDLCHPMEARFFSQLGTSFREVLSRTDTAATGPAADLEVKMKLFLVELQKGCDAKVAEWTEISRLRPDVLLADWQGLGMK